MQPNLYSHELSLSLLVCQLFQTYRLKKLHLHLLFDLVVGQRILEKNHILTFLFLEIHQMTLILDDHSYIIPYLQNKLFFLISVGYLSLVTLCRLVLDLLQKEFLIQNGTISIQLRKQDLLDKDLHSRHL